MLVSGRVAGSHLVLGKKESADTGPRLARIGDSERRFGHVSKQSRDGDRAGQHIGQAIKSSYMVILFVSICWYFEVLVSIKYRFVPCAKYLVSNTLCLKHDSWHHCDLVDQRSMRALSKVEPFTDHNLLGASLGNDLYGKWTL